MPLPVLSNVLESALLVVWDRHRSLRSHSCSCLMSSLCCLCCCYPACASRVAFRHRSRCPVLLPIFGCGRSSWILVEVFGFGQGLLASLTDCMSLISRGMCHLQLFVRCDVRWVFAFIVPVFTSPLYSAFAFAGGRGLCPLRSHSHIAFRLCVFKLYMHFGFAFARCIRTLSLRLRLRLRLVLGINIPISLLLLLIRATACRLDLVVVLLVFERKVLHAERLDERGVSTPKRWRTVKEQNG